MQRTVGVTTARAYLTVFAQKRQVEVNRQARDNSLAHMQYADSRLRGGIGNRVDWARAGQDLEQNEALLQNSYANLYRTQEALGILLGEDQPVDTEDVPEIPGMPTVDQALEESQGRTDILLFRQQEKAADRSLNMSWTEYLPSINLVGQPFYQEPSSLTTPKTGWQVQAILTWYLYDGGARYGRTHEREALLEQARIQLDNTLRQANSDADLRGQHRADDGRGRATTELREAGGGRDAAGRYRLPRRGEHEWSSSTSAPGPGRGDPRGHRRGQPAPGGHRPPVRFRSLPCPADPASPSGR